jgi:hypothetical protein
VFCEEAVFAAFFLVLVILRFKYQQYACKILYIIDMFTLCRTFELFQMFGTKAHCLKIVAVKKSQKVETFCKNLKRSCFMKFLFLIFLFFCLIFAEEYPKYNSYFANQRYDAFFVNPMFKHIELKYLDENFIERKVILSEYTDDKNLTARWEKSMSDVVGTLYILTAPMRIIGAFKNTINSPQDDMSDVKLKVDSLFRSSW